MGVYTAEELSEIDVGSWFDREHPEASERFAGTGIVTLEALFAEFGDRFYYHLELKGDDARLPGRVLERVDAAGLRARVTLTSFSKKQLERSRTLAPDVPVCWLLERSGDGDAARQIDASRAAGFEGVAIPAAELSADVVRYARERGVGVRAWGVSTEADEQRVIRSDVDGATTDWPVRLRDRVRAASG